MSDEEFKELNNRVHVANNLDSKIKRLNYLFKKTQDFINFTKDATPEDQKMFQEALNIGFKSIGDNLSKQFSDL